MDKNELEKLRKEIDKIDENILDNFIRRMKISEKIAEYKKENGKRVFDPAREREKLLHISELSGEDNEAYTRVLFTLLMELSRAYQNKILLPPSPSAALMEAAVSETDNIFPEKAIVACQGTEGAFSMAACEKLFALPRIMYFSSFDAVFSAVEKGLCRYAVLPIENSNAGSVNSIYDAMIKHKFYIVRSTRLRVNHCLLANHGTKLEDIKEVRSHPQALSQCSEFLSSLANVKIKDEDNTAVAAKKLAESERMDAAALASERCAELYNLKILKPSVQNDKGNTTRFICISKKPEIYPGSNRTTMMMVIPHRPGALYRVISRFYSQNINLTKLESRPIPGRDFEFMFYFDVDASVYSESLRNVITELETELEEFIYLGSYSEIV